MALNYEVRRKDGVTILDLRGRLSLGEELAFGPGSGVVLGETVRDLIKKGDRKILLNLAGVTYVDSSGVGQLTGAFTSARNQGAELKLLNPTTPVKNLLNITQLDTLFDIQHDEDAAIKSFNKGAAAQA
jgi:anti-sigma B factor antagonist